DRRPEAPPEAMVVRLEDHCLQRVVEAFPDHVLGAPDRDVAELRLCPRRQGPRAPDDRGTDDGAQAVDPLVVQIPLELVADQDVRPDRAPQAGFQASRRLPDTATGIDARPETGGEAGGWNVEAFRLARGGI